MLPQQAGASRRRPPTFSHGRISTTMFTHHPRKKALLVIVAATHDNSSLAAGEHTELIEQARLLVAGGGGGAGTIVGFIYTRALGPLSLMYQFLRTKFFGASSPNLTSAKKMASVLGFAQHQLKDSLAHEASSMHANPYLSHVSPFIGVIRMMRRPHEKSYGARSTDSTLDHLTWSSTRPSRRPT